MIISCPHCRRRLKVNDNLCGKRGPCPACKQVFTIPVTTTETAKEEEAPKIPPRVSSAASPIGAVKNGEARDPATQRYVPPPPASGTRAGGVKQPTSPPPLPHKLSVSTKAATVPPPLPAGAIPAAPKMSRTTAKVSLDSVMSSLTRALSIKKIGFYMLGAVAIILICGLLSYISIAASQLRSPMLPILIMIITIVFMIGLEGVLTGGVAFMAHMENIGHSVGIGGAFRFCGRRFLSLFGGTILLLLLLLFVPAIVNGFIMLLNINRTVGSFIGALLFLPQAAVNLMFVVAAISTVLFHSAIAVEDIGAFDAIGRFFYCVRHQTGQLMIHLAMTIFLGIIVMTVLSSLIGAAMFPTIATNFPRSASILGSLSGLNNLIGSRHGYWGDSLRYFLITFVFWSVLIYPLVYWIVSFTNYYERTVKPHFVTGRCIANSI